MASIYARIHRNIQRSGSLPANFATAPHYWKEQSEHEGQTDGEAIYLGVGTEPDIAPLTAAVKLASDGAFEEAYDGLLAFFEENRMLLCVDDFNQWLADNAESLNATDIYEFVRRIVFETADKECMKLALTVLEMISCEDDKKLRDAVLEIGLADEFTLFVGFIVSGWAEGNKEIFRLAQHTKGWGRIQMVDMLEPETPRMKEWLLFYGAANTVDPSYSAYTVAQKVSLDRVLTAKKLSQRELDACGFLLEAMCVPANSPLAGLESFEEAAEEMIEAFFKKAEGRKKLNKQMCATLWALSNWDGTEAEERERIVELLKRATREAGKHHV